MLIEAGDGIASSSRGDYEVVYFDLDTHRLVKRSFLTAIGFKKSNLKKYHLYYKSIARIDWKFIIHNPAHEKIADLRLEGKAHILAGSEHLLARFCHENGTYAFSSELEIWKQEFERDRPNSSFRTLAHQKSELIAFLTRKAQNIGVELTLSGSILNERDDYQQGSGLSLEVEVSSSQTFYFAIDYMFKIRKVNLYMAFTEKSEDLNTWLKNVLGRFMKKSLFQKTYDELATNFIASYEPQIRKVLSDRIAEIGLEAELFNLSLKDLTKGFEVFIDDQTEFKSNETSLNVKVVLDVSGDFDDYRNAHVARLVGLQSQDKVNTRMRRDIQFKLRDLIKGLDMAALATENQSGSGTQKHKAQIKNKLEDYLKQQYALQRVDIKIRGIQYHTAKISQEINGLMASFFDSRRQLIHWYQLSGKAKPDASNKAKLVSAIQLLADVNTFHMLLRDWLKEFGKKREKGEIAQYANEHEVMERYIIGKAKEVGVRLILSLKEFKVGDAEIPLEQKVGAKIEGGHEVTVENHLLLRLTDPNQLIKSEESDIESWISKNLRSVIENYLLKKSYIELLLKFDEVHKPAIENEMKARAAQIGYSAEQIILIPKIDELSLKKSGFTFEVGKDNDDVYGTRASDVKVKLEIAISGRISDFTNENVKNYITPGNPDFLITKMKQRVVETTQQYIHSVEPDRYYMRFKEDDEGTTVEEELVNRIRTVLEDEFSADGLSITPKYKDTKLSLRYKALIKNNQRIRVKSANEMVDFEIAFRVLSIHSQGWHTFQSMEYDSTEEELHEIGRLVTDKMELYLNMMLPTDFVGFKNLQFIEDIEELAEMGVQHVFENLGIQIRIVSLKRHISEYEVFETKRLKRELEEKQKDLDLGYEMRQLERDNAKETYRLALEKNRQLELSNSEVDDDDPRFTPLRKNIDKYQSQPTNHGINDKISKLDENTQSGIRDSMNEMRRIQQAKTPKALGGQNSPKQDKGDNTEPEKEE